VFNYNNFKSFCKHKKKNLNEILRPKPQNKNLEKKQKRMRKTTYQTYYGVWHLNVPCFPTYTPKRGEGEVHATIQEPKKMTSSSKQ
jgi:hypothetical protein